MQGSPAKWVLPTGCKVKKWHLKPQTDRWTALAFCASLSLLLFCWLLLFFWGSPALGDLWNWSRLSAPKRRRSFAHTHTQVKTKIIIKTKVEKENKMKNPTRKLSQWGSRIEDLRLVRSRLEFSAGRGLFFGQKKTEIQYNFRRQPQNPKKRNARSKATIRRRRSCRRRLPQFASNFRSWDVP